MVVGRLAYLNTLGNDDGLIIKTLTCEIAALHVHRSALQEEEQIFLF
jgi:hypothetical protein